MPPYCPTEKSFLRLIYIQDHRYAGGLWMKPGNRPSINPLAEGKGSVGGPCGIDRDVGA